MGMLEKLNVAVVGSAGRGGDFKDALQAGGARIHAVCDSNADALDGSASRLGATEKYEDYAAMLEQSELDAVVIATPMPLHVPQSIMALQLGLSVFCEVPAGVSIDECRRLVLAVRQSKGLYMLGENYCSRRPNVFVRELVRHGLFGQTYYAEGEYLHEIKAMLERTPWRRHWQAGIDGITYGTHSLGPILEWMPGDRIVRVACEAGGQDYRDPRGAEYAQQTPVMLAKTARGALVKIRFDILSDRPHATANYQLQGTNGVYESSRDDSDEGRIWLRSLSEEPMWHDFAALLHGELGERFLPSAFRNSMVVKQSAGHGGGDYYEMLDFLEAVRDDRPSPIGIHQAMDMTLPGLVSQESIRNGGDFRSVPDSREWLPGNPLVQLRMRWPQRLLASKPFVRLPDDYQLRQFAEPDLADYLALMTIAGFGGWQRDSVEKIRHAALPGGFFVIVHRPTGRLVATATAMHRPQPDIPHGGELSWVAADPAHARRGLGRAVSAAVVGRFIDAGYDAIYLLTDDHRLPAINVYLQIGFEPDERHADTAARWRAVRGLLDLESP